MITGKPKDQVGNKTNRIALFRLESFEDLQR